MMKYKIWDKKEQINGVEASYFIDSLKIKENDGVFLILDSQDNVQAVEIDRIIKGVYELDSNLTIEEVAQRYIEIKEEEKLEAQKSLYEQQIMSEKIDTLEDDNSTLKAKIQAQEDTMLSNMLAHTETFEMLLALTPATADMRNVKAVSNMAKIYSALVEKGKKNIEEVPQVIREQM